MKLCFLGTGSNYPTTKRGVSSLALQNDDGSVWLFDCGEGTQIQLQKAPITQHKINKVFITHLHGDHLFGLPGLLCTISSQLSSVEDCTTKKSEKDPHIELYGPLGLRRYIYTCLSLSRSPLAFRYKVYELKPVASQYPEDWKEWEVDHSPVGDNHPCEIDGVVIDPAFDDRGQTCSWKLLENSQHTVTAGWIHHRVPCFGYVVQEKDKTGTLNAQKLLELGVKPGPLYGELKSGRTIVTETGCEVTPHMVLGSPIPGRTAVILGDTSDPSPLAPLVETCDVLVHEATHDDSLMDKASEYGHSTPSQAAQFAIRIGAKALLLNHFSQRYSPASVEGSEDSTGIHLNQALEVLKETNIMVECAEDMFIYSVSRQQRNAPDFKTDS